MNINPLRKYPDGSYGSLEPIRFEVKQTLQCPQLPVCLTFSGCNSTQVRAPALSISTTLLEMRQLAGHLLAIADDIEKQGKGSR